MNRIVYGFSGFIGSGKDTASQTLVEATDASKFSFAGTLKDIVSVLFSWDRTLLGGTTKESREWREIEDPYWSKALEFSVTPRKILQLMGTEVFRNFHKDIWIRAAERRLQLDPAPVAVFTDARFGNEMDFIHEQKGTIVWISRPDSETGLPNDLKNAVQTRKPLLRKDAYALKASGLHASETSFLTEGADKIDIVIVNNGTLEDLEDCVEHMHCVIETQQGWYAGIPPNVVPIGQVNNTCYLERYPLDGSFMWTWDNGKLFFPVNEFRAAQTV